MTEYLQGHKPFMEHTIAKDLMHLPIVSIKNMPDSCPDCGYSPMCFCDMPPTHYSKLTCNNPKCDTEIAVYSDGCYERIFNRIRLRQPEFGKALPSVYIVHKKNDLWHIPLYEIRPQGWYQGGIQMFEIWTDNRGNLYLPSKNPEPIEA